MLLWPDAENFPVGGEIDFMEMMDHTRQNTDFFLHYGQNNRPAPRQVRIDATQWHNWAVEWTPDHIAAYVDGKQWCRTERTEISPAGPDAPVHPARLVPEGGPAVRSRPRRCRSTGSSSTR